MATAPRILLISRDLQARARVERAVTEAGATLISTTHAQLAGLGPTHFDVLLQDLDETTGAVAGDHLAKGPGIKIGFYSHVHPELTAEAEAAGWRTMPRGRFWRELPTLLQEALN